MTTTTNNPPENPPAETPWFYASDADAEQWTYGGETRDEVIASAVSDLGDDEQFFITTGHKSRYGYDDDHDPEDFEYTMDSKTPELVTPAMLLARQKGAQ